VFDRWLWLKEYLPKVPAGSKTLLDIGCGTGAFTIGAARRGYKALGLSWDERNQTVAQKRAKLCRSSLAHFEVLDVRHLDEREDLYASFDIVVCCENIEHIVNDQKLLVDMARCLRANGTLLLTTPNFNYRPITEEDNGPFLPIENGGHVRRGYTAQDLHDLCTSSQLRVSEVGYCSGVLSQKVTTLSRRLSPIHPLLGWALTLPFRPLIPTLDPLLTSLFRWPHFCITLMAEKPKTWQLLEE
jgi:SAM-dependent methyltransferase